MERIVAAAVQYGQATMSMPRPARHSDIMKFLWDVDPDHVVYSANQGFLTSEGRFVGRREAATIALEAKQIERLQWGPDLFSEDLW